MRLGLRAVNGLIFGLLAWVAIVPNNEERASELLPRTGALGIAASDVSSPLPELEIQAATMPSVHSVVALSSAYLDREQPGLATAVIEKAPSPIRERPEVAHLYARALFHRGLVREALAVARAAQTMCRGGEGCAPWLWAKTARLVSLLENVAAAGIEDPLSDPEGIQAAYRRSIREMRVVAMR